MSKLKFPHASGNSVSIAAPATNPASDRTLYLPSNADGTIRTTTTSGAQLQVVSTAKTDTWTDTSQSWVDVTGFSLNITPASSSNKILIILDAKVSQGTATRELYLKIVRTISSTAADVYVGDAAGSRQRCTYGFEDADADNAAFEMKQVHGTFLDSPNTTSQINYKIQMRCGTNGGNIYVNRTGTDTDNANFPRCASSITALEVAG
tara:strand:+ start:938 stop:1558 length:621 start_codon:yes stop_codon:yes gene_type:complete